jgi:hypothetical protein
MMKKEYSKPVLHSFSFSIKEALCDYTASPEKSPGFGPPTPAPARRTPLQ